MLVHYQPVSNLPFLDKVIEPGSGRCVSAPEGPRSFPIWLQVPTGQHTQPNRHGEFLHHNTIRESEVGTEIKFPNNRLWCKEGHLSRLN